MTAKEIFLELLKPDGKPERQLVQYEALQMALGDPIGGYLHMGRMPGAAHGENAGRYHYRPLGYCYRVAG